MDRKLLVGLERDGAIDHQVSHLIRIIDSTIGTRTWREGRAARIMEVQDRCVLINEPMALATSQLLSR